MVRRKQSAAVSPQQLKHFAAVAVAVTALLALFASGEQWGVQAQVKAVEAKNRLATTEAEKLGARHFRAKLKLPEGRRSFLPFAQDPPEPPNNYDGGGMINPDSPGPRDMRPRYPLPPPMPMTPGAKVEVETAVPLDAANPGEAPDPAKAKKKNKKPSAEEIVAIKQASRERSGGSSDSD